MFSTLKALVDSEKFQVTVFQYSAENDNSAELGFSLPSIIPRVIEKFRWAKNDNSKLGFASQGIPRFLSFLRIPSYRYHPILGFDRFDQ